MLCDSDALRNLIGFIERFNRISYRNVLSILGGPTVSHRWWSRPPIAGERHETLPVSPSEGLMYLMDARYIRETGKIMSPITFVALGVMVERGNSILIKCRASAISSNRLPASEKFALVGISFAAIVPCPMCRDKTIEWLMFAHPFDECESGCLIIAALNVKTVQPRFEDHRG